MEKLLKRLIWLYVILLVFEGALRKWVLPSLADPLLIIRDPVAIVIYLLAFFTGKFPLNGWMLAIVVLAFCSIVASFAAGQTNAIVLVYGLRINYGHLPLIWVMAAALTRRDVERIGTFLLLVAIPMTLVMVLQFKSPINAAINRGVGGDEGGQIYGALGRIRPPGFFSFITGPQFFYPLVAAFFFAQLGGRRRLWMPLLTACGLAILVALPVSISRTVMLGTGIVGIAFVVSMSRANISLGSHMRTALILGAVAVAVSYLPIFSEGSATFLARWQTAAVGSQGDAWGGIFDRIINGFTQPFVHAAEAPFFGRGIGVGSNVGARLLAGRLGFLLAEDEWGKIFLELGPVLGGAFIIFRLALTASLGLKALAALFSRRDNLPILIFSACAFPVALSQWAPPTILGFAIVGSGLLLASLNEEISDEDESLETEPDETADEAEPVEEQPVRVRY
jgi:hypothetical protein